MKIHKVTKERIFFLTDSGAYGSVNKDDVKKLVTALELPDGKIDARLGGCMTDNFVPVKTIPDELVSNLDGYSLLTKEEWLEYQRHRFLQGTAYPSDGVVFWRCAVWEKEYSHVVYFSK